MDQKFKVGDVVIVLEDSKYKGCIGVIVVNNDLTMLEHKVRMLTSGKSRQVSGCVDYYDSQELIKLTPLSEALYCNRNSK